MVCAANLNMRNYFQWKRGVKRLHQGHVYSVDDTNTEKSVTLQIDWWLAALVFNNALRSITIRSSAQLSIM